LIDAPPPLRQSFHAFSFADAAFFAARWLAAFEPPIDTTLHFQYIALAYARH
jgi:hypothetical protein